MLKYVFGAIIFIAVAIGAYYLWGFIKEMPQQQESSSFVPEQTATSTYATTTFSIVYPVAFSINEFYTYDGVPKKPIYGVSFTVPLTMATGTNLSSESYLSVEWLPRAKNCTGDIYIPTDVMAYEVEENGVSYSIATSTGAAAGNMYEEQVYALTSSSPCTAVRYFIHSSDIGNYPVGTIREFKRTALLRAFDAIRHSLVLISPNVLTQ